MEGKRNFTANQQEENWPGTGCNSAALKEKIVLFKILLVGSNYHYHDFSILIVESGNSRIYAKSNQSSFNYLSELWSYQPEFHLLKHLHQVIR